jgi:ketosteroid isomerase-like protein
MVLGMVVTCGGSWPVCAQETADSAASKVIALENAWNRASEAKDLKALDQILDDDFVYVGDDGKVMRKAEILMDVKQSGVQQVVAESMVARVHGDAAIVTGLYRMKDVVRGKPLTRRGRFVDTWIYRSGRWVGIASIGIPIE